MAAGLNQRSFDGAGPGEGGTLIPGGGRRSTRPGKVVLAERVGGLERLQPLDIEVDQLEPAPAHGSHMLADVARILRLSPEQRLLELRNAARFLNAAKRA